MLWSPSEVPKCVPGTSLSSETRGQGYTVGYVPERPGAHSQGETADELKKNLAEVISMLLEGGERAACRSGAR